MGESARGQTYVALKRKKRTVKIGEKKQAKTNVKPQNLHVLKFVLIWFWRFCQA